MKLKQVKTDLCDVPEVRVTAVYDDEQLQLLRDSLKAMGTVQPIVVVATGERYEIVDGLHRWEEARSRGETTIPAVVYEGSAQDTLLMNLVLNRVRGKTKASEMVNVIGSLWKDHQLDSDTIAARTGLTRDYIEKLQRISTASPPVRKALDDEVIGVGVAYEIARLPVPIQQEEVLVQARTYGLSVKDVHQFVDNVLSLMEKTAAGPVSTVPAVKLPPLKFYCEACKRETDPRYLKTLPLCPDCFGEVWRLAKSAETKSVPAAGNTPPA